MNESEREAFEAWHEREYGKIESADIVAQINWTHKRMKLAKCWIAACSFCTKEEK